VEKILIHIDSPKFLGQSTAFVPSRFTPVVLRPGERVLILRHRAAVTDRPQADALKQASVVFGVSRDFDGPSDWWRGNLEIQAVIRRHIDPEKFAARMKANKERYDARKEAEKDPNFGKSHALRIAALIRGSEMAGIRNEMGKPSDEIKVQDAEWIQQVSEAVADTSLSKSVRCFCIGWRTAYFYKDGQVTASVAAIHGNQLRLRWGDETGDYPINETEWKAVEQALGFP
jgi:hypothetical protein